MKARQFIIVGVAISLVAVSILLSGTLAGMKEPPKKEPVIESKKYVKVQPVAYDDIATQVTAFGRVRTAESLDLIAEVSGRMYRGAVPLKEGQSFSEGTLLYKIDDTEARLNLQSQKSNFLKELAAILPDLKIDFSNNYEVWKDYFESIDLEKSLPALPDYKSSQEKTFLATKNIFSSFYTIKSAEANLKKYRFYAPFDGTISAVNLQSGSYVNAGSNIGKTLRSDKLEIKVDVSVDEINWIEKGGTAVVRSENGFEWTGTITRIGEFINQNTQSIDVHIALQDNGKRLFDGQYLEAKIPGKNINNGMIIPRNAIFNGNEVFVLEDTVLKTKNIKIHKTNAESAVFSGLPEGVQLVVEPLINAHNNMKAFPLEEKDQDIDLEKKNNSNKKIVS
ncbi:MAG: efflux RND transporter periplasmic adaptor subunit [Fulvivirga sp.]|nr:efflux RND transporter periplasmic adaptor subunit [Fulvivirga sp.]